MKAIHKISFLIVIFAVAFAFFFGILNTTTEITYAASKSELTIEGDIATIGEYPQTRVTDDTLFSTLLSLEVGSDGYYTYEGIKYVRCTTKKPNSTNMKWSNGDTIYDCSVEWSQSGSTVTFVWDGNPMVPAGYTSTGTIYDGGTSFGNSIERYKKT